MLIIPHRIVQQNPALKD